MKNLDLDKITAEIDKMVHDRDWDQFHSVKNLSMALSVECSELAEIFQWVTEEKSNQAKHDPKIMAKLEDEVADVFVYLMRIIKKTDIDLEKVVLNKLAKSCAKYPVDKSKGNMTKYTEF